MDPDDTSRLARRLKFLYTRAAVSAACAPPDPAKDPARFRDDPVGFASEVLGVELTPDEARILRKLPGRVKLESGHGVGKSFLMAVALLWWLYTRVPSVVICNAPKLEHLRDVLFAEVRMLTARARVRLPDYFVGPKAPELYDGPDHWAKGYTTSRSESYQGRHRENMLFLFDEDEGIDAVYWTVTGTMYQPDAGHAWLTGCNPTTTSSQSYLESLIRNADGGPKWDVVRMSSLDHPNVAAQLAGLPPPVPNAVTVGQISQWVSDWTTPVPAGDRKDGDVEWPPGSGAWFRPGPTFKSRVLGLRPTEGVDTCWSAAAFDDAVRRKYDDRDCWRNAWEITIGCDPAAYGDDDTSMHVRSGPVSVHHEAHNGWGPEKSAGRLKELCSQWAAWYNSLAEDPRAPLTPEDVVVVIELDGGYGVGVHSHRGSFHNWRGVTVGGSSDVLGPGNKPVYKNLRAELWSESAKLPAAGGMDLSRMPVEVRDRLRLQLLTPYYEVLPNGTRQVEKKADVKARLGRSPDDAEALILSHAHTSSWSPSVIGGSDDPPQRLGR